MDLAWGNRKSLWPSRDTIGLCSFGQMRSHDLNHCLKSQTGSRFPLLPKGEFLYYKNCWTTHASWICRAALAGFFWCLQTVTTYFHGKALTRDAFTSRLPRRDSVQFEGRVCLLQQTSNETLQQTHNRFTRAACLWQELSVCVSSCYDTHISQWWEVHPNRFENT